jgi:hypothetical protein
MSNQLSLGHNLRTICILIKLGILRMLHISNVTSMCRLIAEIQDFECFWAFIAVQLRCSFFCDVVLHCWTIGAQQ